MLDTDSGDEPQLRCTCISPAYQPAGSGTAWAKADGESRMAQTV